MKKKKSSGTDGLSQEHLVLGKENLIPPLTKIFNKSIDGGEFPAQWKDALVSPVLKKGNPELQENYQPVSCLPSASKLLEMVVYRCNENLEHCSHYSDFSPNSGGCQKCNKILCENFTNINLHSFNLYYSFIKVIFT